MNNEIRNELLGIMYLVKGKEENKKFNIEYLLERFEIDIKNKLEDIEYQKRQLNDNLELLNYVKNELLKKEEV